MRVLHVGWAALAAMIVTSSAWGAAWPVPGRYLANIVVTEVRGAECPDRLGADYSGILYYGGLSADRVTVRIPITFDGVPVIDQQVLTITSRDGILRPRGTFTARITDPINLRITGRFLAEFGLSDDPESFRVRLVEMAPTINCAERFRIAAVRAGGTR